MAQEEQLALAAVDQGSAVPLSGRARLLIEALELDEQDDLSSRRSNKKRKAASPQAGVVVGGFGEKKKLTESS